ncbi:pregnancy-specific glycoprotein 22 isoform X3 [Danio rerio]|uniref:Pregnancy-specific glycoprotein 22 isoform X3 n=2 Tax=Danio rerio TaxID=7955 RepID=A0AC58IGL1_DANRE
MKIVLGILFLLPTCGVFGADTDVSVMEGQTVTLNTNNTDIKKITRILWRFRDRLKLNNQTGSLTIMDIKTTDTGLYKAEINYDSETLKWSFNVTVNGSGLSPGAAAGISVVILLLVLAGVAAFVFYHRHKCLDKKSEVQKGEISDPQSQMSEVQKGEISDQQSQMYETKKVSVKVGESVTLKPDAVIQRDDQILWTFGPQETLIAGVNGNTREISTGDCADGRFRDRLRLDSTTGTVTITKTASEHVGVYKLKIISSTGTSYQTFILTLIQDVKSVTEGSSVTLDPDTETQKDDLILWMFGDEDSLIAQLQKTTKTFDGTDARFKNRLNLDRKTGSLTITDIKNYHTGLYKLQISNSSRGTLCKTFKVLVNFEKVSVMEGDPVKLEAHVEIGKKDQIQWLYKENTLLAEIEGRSREIRKYDVGGGRFKGRLMVDGKTGSLTIKNTRPEHTGLYTLKINSSKEPWDKHFLIFVKASMILGKEGNNVTLNVQDELQRDDLILWMFGDEDNLIVQMNGETSESTFTEADERFRNKLLLDKMTGSLTIRNITSEHSGAYKLHIISSRRTFYRRFRVFVCGDSDPNTVSVNVGESLILITNFIVNRDEQLQWTFEGVTLASGMNGDVSKTSYGDDRRFRCRLELHHQSASLTVKNTQKSDSGVYQLKLCNRGGKKICLKVNVTISGG